MAGQAGLMSSNVHGGGKYKPGEEALGGGSYDGIAAAVREECGESGDADEFVSGIGLFRIHSCINHRCERGVRVGRARVMVRGLGDAERERQQEGAETARCRKQPSNARTVASWRCEWANGKCLPFQDLRLLRAGGTSPLPLPC